MMSNNFSFETFTDSGCTITVSSTDEQVELAISRLSYFIFFPLRYSLFIVSIFLSSFFNINFFIIIAFFVPAMLAMFTRYTFLVSGRFLHPFHKRFGSKTKFIFIKNPDVSPQSVSKSTFVFSFQEVIGIAIDGFNRKPGDYFFTYSMIHLLFADNFYLCLGGPFYGRFYTADRTQLIKLEQLHSVIMSVFNLVHTSFPDYKLSLGLEFDDGYISAEDNHSSIKQYIHKKSSSFIPLDIFESYFAKFFKKSDDFEMADFNSFAILGLALLYFIIIFIPIGLIESLNIDIFTSILKSDFVTACLGTGLLTLLLVSIQDMARVGRHMMLPMFAGDHLKYDFVNNPFFTTSTNPYPAPPAPQPYHASPVINNNDVSASTITEAYNTALLSNTKPTKQATIFSSPRNMFEVFVVIFLIPFYIAIAPIYFLKNRPDDQLTGESGLFESFKTATGGEKISVLFLFIVLFVFLGFIWLIGFVFTLYLFWLEIPFALLYYALHRMY